MMDAIPPMNKYLPRFEAALPAALADIHELIACESPSADLAAVARSADLVASIGTRYLGVAPERIVRDGRTHLLWRFGATNRVAIVGHHDTVWPLGSLVSQPVGIVDGILRGPGCFDMKAGLVMAFAAMAALRDEPDLADLDGVSLLVTGDEELGSPTSRDLVEREATGCVAALVLEASADGGAVKTERKGVSNYRLDVEGRAAHAGLEPWKGVNATVELAHQVLAIGTLENADAGTTVTPTTLAAGTARNTVPAAGGVEIDVRARTVAEQERVDAGLRALAPVLDDARLVLSGGPNRPPLEAEASAALYERAVRVARDLGIPQLGKAAVGGGSDGNFTAGIGVPTLDGLGAVGGGAHADDEHVVVAELPRRTALVATLIAELLRESAGARS
jgi:glutamate carboxypeptidase